MIGWRERPQWRRKAVLARFWSLQDRLWKGGFGSIDCICYTLSQQRIQKGQKDKNGGAIVRLKNAR